MASVRNEPRQGKGSSNRIASIDVERVVNKDDHQLATSKHFDSVDDSTTVKVPTWRKFLSFVGPGFLVSLAYLDPGNLETDLQAGANHRYELLWVILIGLIFALIIQSLAANLGVSTGCYSRSTGELNPQCNDLNLNSASFLLQNVLGRKSAKIIYAVALFASGQSSTITGTYAGQFIMQGFLDIKMRKWLRNLMTRTIAIAPSLVVKKPSISAMVNDRMMKTWS